MSNRHANAEGLASAVATLASPEAINARLVKAGLPAMNDRNVGALALVKSSGIKSQGEATVLIINLTEGRCTGDQVTVALKAAFPGAKISSRHGPHYLSLARTGKLEGVETSTIPHSARKSKKSTPVVTPPAAPVVSETGAEHVATLEAAGVEVVDPVHEAAEHSALVAADLKAELSALSQKDLAARAKAVGVKAIGKKDVIIAAIIAAS